MSAVRPLRNPQSAIRNRGAVVWAAAVLLGCGGGGRPQPLPSPQELYEQGLHAYRRGDCEQARRALEQLSFDIAARDPMQGEVQYYLAECRLAGGEPLEAARLFRRVADDFPRHRLAPDALLRAGDAYAELWKDPALDPSYGENAVDVWRELLGRYPESTAAQRGRLRIRQLNEMFAEKEYENGVFYLRLRAYDSAIIHFKDVVADYPQSSFAPRAVLRLIEVYDRIAYEEEKREMCEHLRRFYPQAATDAERCPPRATPS